MHQNHCSTPARRIHLASAMLAGERKYGFVSQLSREQNISRQSLYLLKSRGQEAMERVFKTNQFLAEGEIQIERAVLTLFTEAHASREGIQICLEELLGVHVSTGKISSILHEAGKRAQEWLDQQIPEGMRDLAIDEQYSYQRGEAYLNIVDAHTTFVYASCPPVAVDGESWALLFLQMKDHGLRWRVVVSDGGKAIGRAVHELTPDVIHQRDVWHVIHECQKVQRRMDRAVASLSKRTPAVERNAKRVKAGKKPLGRNPKSDVQTHAGDLHQMQYVATSLRYLTCELQRLLEIVVLTDQEGILGSQARQEECDALLDLFAHLCEVTPPLLKKTMEKLLRHVQLALPNLLAFCPLLDTIQQAACEQLGEAAVHLIGWAWQRRAILGSTCEQLVVGFPPSWQPQASKVLAAWDQAVRSSSAVENWHSILRPFIAVHRHLSADMLAILAVWHNHRVASRGLHQGQSPLTRTGLAKQPTDWLAALDYARFPSPSPQSIPISIVRSSPEMESIAA